MAIHLTLDKTLLTLDRLDTLHMLLQSLTLDRLDKLLRLTLTLDRLDRLLMLLPLDTLDMLWQ